MSAPALAQTSPPYYAAIFTSQRTEGDQGYGDMAERMGEHAGHRDWKANTEHRIAQETGKQVWYADDQLRVAKVERAYGKPHESSHE